MRYGVIAVVDPVLRVTRHLDCVFYRRGTEDDDGSSLMLTVPEWQSLHYVSSYL